MSFRFAVIILVLLTGWLSCSNDHTTTIKILCQECSGSEISLTRWSDLPLDPIEIHQSRFDSLGYAEIEFEQNDTLNVLLMIDYADTTINKFYATLYLEPASKLDIAIQHGVPVFTGELDKVNLYYHKIRLVERERSQYVNQNLMSRLSSSSQAKDIFLDSLTKFGGKLKDDLRADNSISTYYQKMLLNHFSLYESAQRMHFETQVAFTDVGNKGMSVVLDSTLSNAFEHITVEQKYIKYPFYTSYLSNRLKPIFDDILNYHYDHKIKMDDYKYVRNAVFKTPKLNNFRELILATFVAQMSYSARMNYTYGEALIKSFSDDFPQSVYLKELNNMLVGFDELREGMPMKDLAMRDVNGANFQLSSLKGDLIYIDIWATWCGPCVDELPYSVRLKDKYSKYSDLKFLFLYVDKNVGKWKKYLQQNQHILGIHGNQNTEFVPDSALVTSLYRINGIPRYILIGKDGNIITTNAPRPSELLVTNYLDSLLSSSHDL